jgi:hypothetical protein
MTPLDYIILATGPVLPDRAVWVVPLLLAGPFLLVLAAAVIGPIYRANVHDQNDRPPRH